MITPTMDAPPVRYTETSDGMRIAYIVEGRGDPVVELPFHHNQVDLRWQNWDWARGLAGEHRVLIYDSRGQGLSTRGLDRDPTIDDYRLDLDAAIAAAGFESFALVAYGGFAHVAIRYALDHPERVRGLVLICTAESHSAWPQAFFLSLAEENWDLFLDLEMHSNWSESGKRNMRLFSKASASQADYVRMVRCFAASNVADALPKLNTPTLILHSKDQHWLSSQAAAELASKIAGARLIFLDGHIEPDHVAGARAMLAFLRELPPDVDAPARRSGATPSLSARQHEVLALVARGKTNREIAEALVLSERTVQRHIADLYARIGVRNRSEATAFELSRPTP